MKLLRLGNLYLNIEDISRIRVYEDSRRSVSIILKSDSNVEFVFNNDSEVKYLKEFLKDHDFDNQTSQV